VKVSDQISMIKKQSEVRKHSFLNQIANAIISKINADVHIPLKMVGKTVSNGTISVTIVGQLANPDPDVSDKIRVVLDELRNPASISALVK